MVGRLPAWVSQHVSQIATEGGRADVIQAILGAGGVSQRTSALRGALLRADEALERANERRLSGTANLTNVCWPGTYLHDGVCQACEIGFYKEYFSDDARNCSLCPAGTFNTKVEQTTCLPCDIGKLASPDRTHCIDCKAGGYNFNNSVRGYIYIHH